MIFLSLYNCGKKNLFFFRQNPLWNLRNIAAHRGLSGRVEQLYLKGSLTETLKLYSEIRSEVYGTDFLSSVYEINHSETYTIDYGKRTNSPEQVIKDCTDLLKNMKKILEEAENEFGLLLIEY
jgi:hypothetical protein